MSFARIAASAAVFTLLSAGFAIAKPVTTTGETNLRKSPGTDSPVITLIPKGTSVEVGKCTNGWCETSFNGQDGYAIGQNLGMATARRAPRGPMVAEGDGYGPPPGYVVGPPGYYGYYRPYYGYGPYYGGYYGGWGYRGGWGWRGW
jgi:Bacterial SH3 domain